MLRAACRTTSTSSGFFSKKFFPQPQIFMTCLEPWSITYDNRFLNAICKLAGSNFTIMSIFFSRIIVIIYLLLSSLQGSSASKMFHGIMQKKKQRATVVIWCDCKSRGGDTLFVNYLPVPMILSHIRYLH